MTVGVDVRFQQTRRVAPLSRRRRDLRVRQHQRGGSLCPAARLLLPCAAGNHRGRPDPVLASQAGLRHVEGFARLRALTSADRDVSPTAATRTAYRSALILATTSGTAAAHRRRRCAGVPRRRGRASSTLVQQRTCSNRNLHAHGRVQTLHRRPGATHRRSKDSGADDRPLRSAVAAPKEWCNTPLWSPVCSCRSVTRGGHRVSLCEHSPRD